MAAGNAPAQVAELKALRREFAGAGTFEFMGPKVPEATAESPTAMRFLRTAPALLTVHVALPAAYPSDAPPVFRVESAPDSTLDDAQVDAIEAFLAEQASWMRGMPCVSSTLLALDDLDLAELDLGTPGRCRSIFTLDLVNNSPHFKKALDGATAGNPCVYFFRTSASIIACPSLTVSPVRVTTHPAPTFLLSFSPQSLVKITPSFLSPSSLSALSSSSATRRIRPPPLPS